MPNRGIGQGRVKGRAKRPRTMIMSFLQMHCTHAADGAGLILASSRVIGQGQQLMGRVPGEKQLPGALPTLAGTWSMHISNGAVTTQQLIYLQFC